MNSPRGKRGFGVQNPYSMELCSVAYSAPKLTLIGEAMRVPPTLRRRKTTTRYLCFMESLVMNAFNDHGKLVGLTIIDKVYVGVCLECSLYSTADPSV